MIEEKQLIKIGKLFKPHGYKGEINAVLDFPKTILESDIKAVFMDVDGAFVPFFPESVRPKGEDVLITFEDLDSLEEVKPYVNKSLYCLKQQVADCLGVPEDELDEENDELIGFDVIDSRTGEKLGVVSDIQEAKEYDYLVVERVHDPENPLLIPFIEEFVDYYEEEEDGKGYISLILPDGMIDLND